MMFEAMGCDDPAQLDAAAAGLAASSSGVAIDQHPSGPSNPSGQIGYIMNVVIAPRYRRRDIARRIMQAMLKWLAEQGIQQAALHTTEMGRPLYEELGFVTSNEMQLRPCRENEV